MSKPYRSAARTLAAILMLALLVCGCDRDRPLQPGEQVGAWGAGDFELGAKYSRIRSCPQGGGVFILLLTPGPDLSGDVLLKVDTDPHLNAELDRAILNSRSAVAEVSIRPDADVDFNTYEIKVEAANSSTVRTLSLQADVLQWPGGVSEDAKIKRDKFFAWFDENQLDFGDLEHQKWFAYVTYPQILVVEHWTFLSRDWEVRLCYHVMIPPYDWSMMRLRRRGQIEPLVAARMESDGTIYQIPVSEYPEMFGY